MMLRALIALLLLAAPATAQPALWRIADADTDMLLFGTIHVLHPDSVWLDDAVRDAVDGADVLVLETELDGDAQARASRLAERHSYLRPGQALSEVLGDDAPLLAQAAAALDLDPALLQSYRPWMASLVLSLRFAELQGQEAAAGADVILLERARSAGARIAYLETPEQQIAVFTELSPQGEREMLAATLREIAETPDILARMDAAWLGGDTDALAALSIDSMRREAPELYDAALLARNRAWTEQLDAMMDRPGRIFVAVGAGHLLGGDSIQALMQARGHEAERLR